MRLDPAAFEPKHFLWDFSNGVATVTLNRPERKNPLTFDSYAELRDMFRALKEARDVKCVVLTGAGGNFCSGGDVHEIIGPLTRMDLDGLLKFTRMTGDLVRAMRACPQPLVAAVEGVCAGAGAILAMASDLRLAAPGAKIAFLFTRVGLSGADMGACAILPRIIGHGRAAELLFTGRNMSAEEGHAWGFFSRICDDVQAEAQALARELADGPSRAHFVTKRQLDAEWAEPIEIALDVQAEAQALARELADGPSRAHFVTKRQLDAEWAEPIEIALDMEAEAQAALMQSNDFKRAYEAFAAKRTPEFRGD